MMRGLHDVSRGSVSADATYAVARILGHPVMQRLVIIIVGIPLVVFGLVKGYLWYSVKEQLDKVVNQLSPIAAVKYGAIHTSLSGTVGVEDITIAPYQLQDTIRIGSIIYDAKSLGGLVKLKRLSEKATFPEEFDIAINDFKLDMNAHYLGFLDQQEANLFGLPIDALGCGKLTHFGPAELHAMGYTVVDVDIKFGFRFDLAQKYAETRVDFSADEIASGRFEQTFYFNAPSLAVAQAVFSKPGLTSMSLTYSDHSYNTRKNEYCAKLIDTSVEEFIDRHLARTEAFARGHGFIPGQELLDGYRDFLVNSGEVHVAVNPVEPFDITTLKNYNVNDLMEWLNLEVRVNGKRVEDLGLHSSFAARDPAGSTPAQQAQPPGAARPRPSRRVPGPPQQKTVSSEEEGYHTATVRQLPEHLGKYAKITTRDGREFAGTIQEITSTSIKIKQRMHQGSVTLPVRITEVRTIRVYR